MARSRRRPHAGGARRRSADCGAAGVCAVVQALPHLWKGGAASFARQKLKVRGMRVLKSSRPFQVFRLSFGPKSFVVVSDAEVARQILLTNAGNYSKGLLSEILDFVMGKGAPRAAFAGPEPCLPVALVALSLPVLKLACQLHWGLRHLLWLPAGLIPADGEIWKTRRRAIVPSLHRKYIESMVAMFGGSALHGARTLQAAALARPHRMRAIGVGVACAPSKQALWICPVLMLSWKSTNMLPAQHWLQSSCVTRS